MCGEEPKRAARVSIARALSLTISLASLVTSSPGSNPSLSILVDMVCTGHVNTNAQRWWVMPRPRYPSVDACTCRTPSRQRSIPPITTRASSLLLSILVTLGTYPNHASQTLSSRTSRRPFYCVLLLRCLPSRRTQRNWFLIVYARAAIGSGDLQVQILTRA